MLGIDLTISRVWILKQIVHKFWSESIEINNYSSLVGSECGIDCDGIAMSEFSYHLLLQFNLSSKGKQDTLLGNVVNIIKKCSWLKSTESRFSCIHICTLIGFEGCFSHNSSTLFLQILCTSKGSKNVPFVTSPLQFANSFTFYLCWLMIWVGNKPKACICSIRNNFMSSEILEPNS